MAAYCKRIGLLLLACLLTFTALAAPGPIRESLGTQIMIISIINWILFVTSLISIIQFFLRDGHNRTPFQLFNILFVTVFYAISFIFLINHKSYFEGYGTLSNKDAVIHYFLDKDIITWLKLVIPLAFLLNIVYVLKNARSYYLE